MSGEGLISNMRTMPPTDREVIAELRRATVLFQARQVAAVIGAPPPKSEEFKR